MTSNIVRHGKPSIAYKATLRTFTTADWDSLVQECLSALILDEQDITLAVTYTLKFPKGFPKGVREHEEGPVNYHRIKARKLMVWLYEQGHTSITLEDVARAKFQFSMAEKEFANF